ncbi:CLUMA_CG006212, isoform A [Clunio marinus]|uniref:CLUMA_CG006212, isoform A n=1 Tax=Clunio marinus TaxID=568069 RepID=A0A1J1HX12_9DIPT|nr:CLUMA_CG006212, isoform A [Clunio marinus]
MSSICDKYSFIKLSTSTSQLLNLVLANAKNSTLVFNIIQITLNEHNTAQPNPMQLSNSNAHENFHKFPTRLDIQSLTLSDQ